ncbi:M48 family metalloprotease [Mucilaginibacter mali]|uniref:M48 family metalloprotease n=1 Tax=Mucilaginibacter mali TaxID=2740462 RepID=A0A7D4QE60_9SPHI|nr:M56 family metallopeptidase [Mucilaginibacter mali]QKJ29472.1 M48 family metalloprotease [Mucilaginibacter mali]
MENLFYNISQVLGITIIHSLWQGLTIFMVLHAIMQFAPNLSANAKYKLAFGALTLMLGWFIYTLATEVNNYTWSAVTTYQSPLPLSVLLPQAAQRWVAPPADHYTFLIAGYMPYLTMLYIAGLVFNTLKMGLAWNNIYRIKQQTIASEFQQQVDSLAKKMNISRFVKVAFSQYIDVPCITGFIKPIILLPCTISTYLSADEIQAILLHELAHIRRNDYLLNLLQQAIGILLFFNPFSILINRIINRERENCCDDVVVQTTGSPLIYAQALLKLEQNKQADWQLALAATGKQYHLLNRIERIMKTKKSTVNIRPALIALALLTCSLTSIAWFNPKIKDGKITVKSIPNALNTINFGADTVIKQKAKTTKPVAKSKPSSKKQAMKIAKDGEYVNDAKMEALSAEMEKHAQKLEQYYNSPEFKKMQEDMEKKGAEMEAYFNSPKMKELQEQMEKKGLEFEKMNDSPEMKKLHEQLEATSKKMEAYYSSPEYAKIQKQYEKQAQLFATAKPGTAEYKKQEAEFKALAGKFKDYTNSSVVKEQAELARKISEQMRGYYQGPEFKKMQDEMRAYGDSMRHYYQNPMMKEQQEAMRKMGETMREYQKNPDIMREKEEMKKLEKEMREYRNSPDYRRKIEAEIENTNRDVKERVRAEIAETRARAERASGDTGRIRERRVMPSRVVERSTKARSTDTGRIRERRVAPARAERPTKTRAADTSRVRERATRPTKPATAAIIEAKVLPATESVAAVVEKPGNAPGKAIEVAPIVKPSTVIVKSPKPVVEEVKAPEPAKSKPGK